VQAVWQPWPVGAPILLVRVVVSPNAQLISTFRRVRFFNGRFTSVLGACSLFGAPLALSG